MIALLWASLALAAPAPTPFTFAAATGPGFGPPSVGWSGSVHAMAHLGAFGVEGVIKEGMWTEDTRSVGALSFSGRWRPTKFLALRAGFVHHHESTLDVMKEYPLGSAFGAAPGIVHRSGMEAALQLDLPVGWGGKDRWGVFAEVGVSGFPERMAHHADHDMPMNRGPSVYTWVEVGLSFDVGRKRDLVAAAPMESVAVLW